MVAISLPEPFIGHVVYCCYGRSTSLMQITTEGLLPTFDAFNASRPRLVEHVGASARTCLVNGIPVRVGVMCETAWLPDSFGLSGVLSKILRLSGMKVRFLYLGH